MLHIKDIEAFARINEALNEDSGTGEADRAGQPDRRDTATGGPTHPALVMAMLATGRLPLSALPKTSTPSNPAPSTPDMPAPWNRLFRRS